MERTLKLTDSLSDLNICDELKSILEELDIKIGFDLFVSDSYMVYVKLLKTGMSMESAQKEVLQLYSKVGIKNPHFFAKDNLMICEKLTSNSRLPIEKIDKLLDCPIGFVDLIRNYEKDLAKIGIETMGDFLVMPILKVRELYLNNTYLRNNLFELFNAMGYESDAYVGRPWQRITEAVLGNSKTLTDKEIEEIWNLPIEVICTNDEYLKNLKDLGIVTIGDMSSKALRKEVKAAFKHNNTPVEFVRTLFKKCNKQFSEDECGWAYYNFDSGNQSKIMFATMKDSEKLQFLNLGIENINMPKAAVIVLKNNGVNAIKDILKLSPGEIKKLINNNNYCYASIVNYLKMFGICTKQDKRKPHIPQKIFDATKASNEEREELLSRPIESLNITIPAINKLKNNDVLTIGDLIKRNRLQVSIMLNHNPSALKTVRDELQKYGLVLPKFNRSAVEVKFTPRKIEIVDVNTLTEEERVKYLQTSVEEVGLTKLTVKKLRKYGVETIEDLTKISRKDFNEKIFNGGNETGEIRKFLESMGLSYEYNRTMGETRTQIDSSVVRKMDEEQKREFMQRNISDIGLPKIIVEKLAGIGLHTIVDVAETDKNQIRESTGLRNDRIQELERKLYEYNVFMKGSNVENIFEKVTYTDRKIDPVDIYSLNDVERKEILSRDVEDLGLPSYVLPKFERKGILKISDLECLTLRQLYNMLRKGDKYREITGIFEQYGIRLEYDSKKSIIEGTDDSGELVEKENSGAQTYKKRQMDHLAKFVGYIQTKTTKKVDEDTKIQ